MALVVFFQAPVVPAPPVAAAPAPPSSPSLAQRRYAEAAPLVEVLLTRRTAQPLVPRADPQWVARMASAVHAAGVPN